MATHPFSQALSAMDHDRLFKELLTTFFPEFLELFCSGLSAYLEPGSVEFLDKEVFTDVTEGESHEADIVAKARFRGKELAFLIHVEAQWFIRPKRTLFDGFRGFSVGRTPDLDIHRLVVS